MLTAQQNKESSATTHSLLLNKTLLQQEIQALVLKEKELDEQLSAIPPSSEMEQEVQTLTSLASVFFNFYLI